MKNGAGLAHRVPIEFHLPHDLIRQVYRSYVRQAGSRISRQCAKKTLAKRRPTKNPTMIKVQLEKISEKTQAKTRKSGLASKKICDRKLAKKQIAQNATINMLLSRCEIFIDNTI